MPMQPSQRGLKKLWIYTNFDCNLQCCYCVARSSPRAARRALPLEAVCRLVDEAQTSGFEEVLFTGGEPFLLEEIYTMLAYSSARLATTVLTNAMLLRGRRLEQLCALRNPNLAVQVSLDGGCARDHDAYRGPGSWEKTVEGIRLLLEHGWRVRLSSTKTPANSPYLAQLCAFHAGLGIPEADHFIRPMARRGSAQEGLALDRQDLVPELTASLEGFFWHPLSTDEDMQVCTELFPLRAAVERVGVMLQEAGGDQSAPQKTFT